MWVWILFVEYVDYGEGCGIYVDGFVDVVGFVEQFLVECVGDYCYVVMVFIFIG